MKILVTGSQGTIGHLLVDTLRTRGHTVSGCDLFHTSDASDLRADLGDYRQTERVLETFTPDLVYATGAEFGRENGAEYPEQLWRTNVIGTEHLLSLQCRYAFKLVFFSSSEIYGEGDYWDRQLLDEAMSQRVPLVQHNSYALSKRVGELQIRNHLLAHPEQQVMVLRLFNAYGPGEYYHPYRSVCCLFAYHALTGQPYTVYRGYHRVFMYLGDLLPTLARCAEDFYPGETINIGGTEYRSVEDLHAIVSHLLDLPLHRAGVTILERDGHNTVNKRPDITKATRLLGHQPKILLEEGIAQTIAWLRSVYVTARGQQLRQEPRDPVRH
jgi:dTDP-glucose 4,6-dehydratase